MHPRRLVRDTAITAWIKHQPIACLRSGNYIIGIRQFEGKCLRTGRTPHAC
jgi:hypothetical protein